MPGLTPTRASSLPTSRPCARGIARAGRFRPAARGREPACHAGRVGSNRFGMSLAAGYAKGRRGLSGRVSRVGEHTRRRCGSRVRRISRPTRARRSGPSRRLPDSLSGLDPRVAGRRSGGVRRSNRAGEIHRQQWYLCQNTDPVHKEERPSKYGQTIAVEVALSTPETNPPVHSERRSRAPKRPEIGSEFLGFRLVEELGTGAFGRVFLAWQGDLAGRSVALKSGRACSRSRRPSCNSSTRTSCPSTPCIRRPACKRSVCRSSAERPCACVEGPAGHPTGLHLAKCS